jgi:hypothetical protein
VAGDEADVQVGLAVGLGLPAQVEGFGVVGLAAPAGVEVGAALVLDGEENAGVRRPAGRGAVVLDAPVGEVAINGDGGRVGGKGAATAQARARPAKMFFS